MDSGSLSCPCPCPCPVFFRRWIHEAMRSGCVLLLSGVLLALTSPSAAAEPRTASQTAPEWIWATETRTSGTEVTLREGLQRTLTQLRIVTMIC